MEAAASVHPTDEKLSHYGLGKLDDPAAEAIGQHLEGCEDCRRRVGELSSDSFVGRLREARPQLVESSDDASRVGNATLSFASPQGTADSPPEIASIPPGLTNHPDYQIRRELGRGGMGVVYLAHNLMMGRDEVLKVINREVMERPGVLDRFQREIRAVAKLRHPNIVAGYSAFRIEGGLVFAMEYVPGLDLAKMVKLKGPLPVLHAAYFAHQAALGLQHAHERGMIHRDIKPHNLMLTGEGKARIVKVLDFGLAKANLEGSVDTSLTREGQALGTPDYIAPEQILNANDVDIRADIYSLGGTLYYLLTGRPPFSAASLYDIYQAHISRDADPLNLIRPEVPAELAALVAKMLAKEPRRRFQTPREVAEALVPFFKKARPMSLSMVVDPAPSRPAEEKPTPAIPAARPPQPAQEVATGAGEWNKLVSIPESHDLSIRPEPGKRPRVLRPRSLRKVRASVVAVGLLSLSMIAAWAGIFRVKTAQGDLLFSGLPEQAEVTVDGKVTTVEWPEGQDTARAAVSVGDHKVKVLWKGVEIGGETVTIAAGDRKPITIRLEAPKPRPPADLVQAGSVWIQDDNGVELRMTILERNGERFKAILVFGDMVREFNGTIQGDRMQLLARDAKVFSGPPLVDHDGVIDGDKITITGYETDGSVIGRETVHLAKRPNDKPPPDLARVGSVWVPDNPDVDARFTIVERDGERFKGIYVYGELVREFNGTIKGDRIQWFARDGKVFSGPPASDHDGVIDGDRMTITRYNADGSFASQGTIHLVKPELNP